MVKVGFELIAVIIDLYSTYHT